jgi:nucleosome assembly protein 1-like 1
VNQKDVMAALGQLGGNPGLVRALQGKLDGLAGKSSGFIEELHYMVKARVGELDEIQEQHDELREKFLEERRALEAKYRELYAPLYVKRAEIVKGEVDVVASKPDPENAGPHDDEDPPKGIPDFWLCALRNHEALEQIIEERDEPALSHLLDITSRPLTKEDAPKNEDEDEDDEEEEEDEVPKGFALEFHFEQPNPFFTNATLTKVYHMVDDEDEEEEEDEVPKGFALEFHFEQPNPFFTNATLTKVYHMVDDEDPILEFSEGTEIDWLPGKNLCVKVMRRKASAKKGGKKSNKPDTKTERTDSFFNFFSPPPIPDEDAQLDDEELEQLQDAMEMDYEMGSIIKDKIIPDAVSWFTGAANEDDSDDEDYDEDEDDDEDDDDESVDDEDSDDDDEGGAGKGADGEKPPECKQQ